MNVKEICEIMQKIENNLLEFIESEDNVEENFQNLQQIFHDQKIHDDKYKLISTFHLIAKIANNHHHEPNFYDKICQILTIFSNDIKKYFSNIEIFNIFKENKRILLFHLENQNLNFDKHVVKKIIFKVKYINTSYPQYFSPEIRPFMNEKWFPQYDPENFRLVHNKWVEDLNKDIPNNFYELRKQGENDNFICQLIRNDSIQDFISIIIKNSYSLNGIIQPSIYETNSFLLTGGISYFMAKNVSFIVYAAFCGSIQIFKYLMTNGAYLDPQILLYAIHGHNAEIINILEDKNIKPIVNCFKLCYIESIKCHHNFLSNYIMNNYSPDNSLNDLDLLQKKLKYHNFVSIENDSIDKSCFIDLCHYDYPALVSMFLKSIDIKTHDKISNSFVFFCLNFNSI